MKTNSTSSTHQTVKSAAVPTALTNFRSYPDDAVIGVRTVAALFDAGVSTIWARVKRGELPKPQKFGRSTRWQVGAIRRVLAGEVAQ